MTGIITYYFKKNFSGHIVAKIENNKLDSSMFIYGHCTRLVFIRLT